MSCAVAGCSSDVRANGLCTGHLHRLYRHGDPLKGRVANGRPQQYLDETVLGFTSDECLIWPFARDGHGYARIKRDGRPQIVCRIVCETRNGPPPTPDHQAAHICGKGKAGCVNPKHLAWKTQSENEADKFIHGTRVRAGSQSQRRTS